jgi:DNA helicase HerA-like ATPase
MKRPPKHGASPVKRNPLDFNLPTLPNHSAIRITTGVGKSATTRTALASYVHEAKKRGIV